MASKQKPIPERTWFKANLTPMAKGLFTDSFYPEPNKAGEQVVYFTQVDVTPSQKKVIAVSKMVESGIRMMTLELALNCLSPKTQATIKDTKALNLLTAKLKI